jgi:hypothetical protein
LHQRRAEGHRAHGSLEQIHLEAWRTGATFVQATQTPRESVWTPEADQALAQLKDFLSKPLVLKTPRK